MDELLKWIDEIANDLWHRFRAMALVIDQAQRFVPMPQGTESINEEELWLQKLPDHPDEITEIAKDLVLRAFHTASDSTNFLILEKLTKETSVAYSDLMQATQLHLLPVSERVNDLIQVGLAVKDVQTGQVRATKAAQMLMEVMESTTVELAEIILKKMLDLRKQER